MQYQKARPHLSNIASNGCVTVVSVNQEGNQHYTSLCPGQLDKARRLLPDELYEQVEELWTEDVIAGYRQSLKEGGENEQ